MTKYLRKTAAVKFRNFQSVVWKSAIKHDSYGKSNIFSVISSLLIKKLLKSWFHGIFWTWNFKQWNLIIFKLHHVIISTNHWVCARIQLVITITYLIWKKNGVSWGIILTLLSMKITGKSLYYGRFYGRSMEIDRPVGRQKSTATDRLRPTANTTAKLAVL